MLWILAPALTLAIANAAAATPQTPEMPFSFDAAPGRLPKNVVPESYAIRLTPHIESLSIDGSESVSLRMRSATDRILFNSLNTTFSDVQLDARRPTVTFEPTPRMPSYLVELTAGDLAAIEGQSGSTRTDYNAYFAYPYPLPKLDSIAIPGGFPGAMENWGAITYQDLLLLMGPDSTLAQQQGSGA